MARINVDQKALTDPRFALLGASLGAPPEHARAVGLYAAIRLWNHCTETGRHRLEPAIIDSIEHGLASALVVCGLASPSRTLIRVHGTKGRIEYMERLRDGNRIRKARSRARHAGVTRDNPGAPAPAPAPATTTETAEGEKTPKPPRAPRAARVEPPGFVMAYTNYPHFEHRSDRAESRKVWAKRNLEPIAKNVLDWIDAMAGTEDWTKDGGRYVKGMQAWLRSRNFDIPPEPIDRAPITRLSPAGQATAQAAQRWMERTGTEDDAT